jgi:methylase of polypeptide subunit release factors
VTDSPTWSGLLDPDAAQRVSDSLRRSAFTVDEVTARLGSVAVNALGRGETAAARLALGNDDDPGATLIRLFLLGDTLPRATVGSALPLSAANPLLTRDGDEVTAAYDVSPHADPTHAWWVVADLTTSGRPSRRDHVLGVGGASTTLAELTIRRPVRRALDIGTGCGVQALHLSTHAGEVTATDRVPRALGLAATSFALSGVQVELVHGDLAAPVEGREYDLVVCNPPFVVGPAARFDYRDAALPADEMSRLAVRAAAGVLAEGGVAQLLVNWLHVRGEDWRDRVATWVADLGSDAWLIERDRQAPADYVATWLDDAAESGELAGDMLRWLASLEADAVGFGWVLLRRSEAPHRVAVETLTHPVDQPLGESLAAWLDVTSFLRRSTDADLLEMTFAVSPLARLDISSCPGESGWQERGRALRLDGGLRWTLPCDEATAALVAGCDGVTPLHRLADVLTLALEGAPDDVVAAVCTTVRGLLDRGVLLPPAA